MAAALSAAHLAAILFPATLRRLYVVRDNDPAGDGAMARLVRPGAGGRDRGDRAVATAGGFQRGSAPPRHRCTSGRGAGADRARRTSPDSCSSERLPGRGSGQGVTVFFAFDLACFPLCRRGPRPRPSERATVRQTARPRNGVRRLFSVAPPRRRFTSRSKIAGSCHPPLRFGLRSASRCRSGPPAAFRRHEGRDGRGRSDARKAP